MSNILFVKTFVDSGTGASLPETDLFIAASFIELKYPGVYQYTFFNSGYDYENDEKFLRLIKDRNVDIVLFSANVWEAELLHKFAGLVKLAGKDITVAVSGQLASIVKERLLQDFNIDIVVYGESYVSFCEVADSLNKKAEISAIEGICFRKGKDFIKNPERPLYDNVDDFVIADKIWNSVDVKKYSRYQGWNGINKENFYMPVSASFGCPFECSYCTNRMYLGQKFRKRSVAGVAAEIKRLTEKFNVKEIHFFDAVFNFDTEWSKSILRAIIAENLQISIAFPHGLRVDRIDNEMIDLFKRSGVYKVTYAIETASMRIQKEIRKNLDLDLAKKIIKETSDKNIIVCGYFMLGFENETEEEMMQTVNYACGSDFDIASFFKYSHLYESAGRRYDSKDGGFMNFSYFSNDLNSFDSARINYFILSGQRKFYLNFRRLFKLFLKTKRKIKFLLQTAKALIIIFQGYLLSKIYYSLNKDKKLIKNG